TIYVVVIGLLVYYFNTRHVDNSKHYVKKDEHRIQVSLSAPKKEKISKPKPKKKHRPQVKNKVKTKHIKKRKVKETKKKIIKEKMVKKPIKKKDENLTKPKKHKVQKTKKKKQTIKPKKTIDLFSKIKTKKKKIDIKMTDTPTVKKTTKNLIKVSDATPSALKRIDDVLKNKKQSDKGVENAYFAHVQAMLESWPAQSDFLGEKATVTLLIKPSGMFEFQVTSGSNNEAFSRSVMDFLTQLQSIGFGRHHAGRNYEFEVEFSAKE
ncbi:MAG TPA: hypothetical protein ENK66_01565, partial [Arcobacter sp.]|nr:hypothetical protein [Arcobacter sp.]